MVLCVSYLSPFPPSSEKSGGNESCSTLPLVPATLNPFVVIVSPNSENSPYEEAIIGSSSFYKWGLWCSETGKLCYTNSRRSHGQDILSESAPRNSERAVPPRVGRYISSSQRDQEASLRLLSWGVAECGSDYLLRSRVLTFIRSQDAFWQLRLANHFYSLSFAPSQFFKMVWWGKYF